MSFGFSTAPFFSSQNSAPNEFQRARFPQQFPAPSPHPPQSAFGSVTNGVGNPHAFAPFDSTPIDSANLGSLNFAQTPKFPPNVGPNVGASRLGSSSTANSTNFGANSVNFPPSSANLNNIGSNPTNFGSNSSNFGSNFANFPTNSANSANFGPNSANPPNPATPTNSLNSGPKTTTVGLRKREKKRDKLANSESVPFRIPTFPKVPFPSKTPTVSNDLLILKPLPAPVTSCEGCTPNQWDLENQQRMLGIEEQYLTNEISLPTAYERLTAMHKHERTEMEQRGLVDSVSNRRELSDAIRFVGSCREMCPVYERVRRAHENDVLLLEKNAHGQADRSKAIKAFTRSSAGQLAPLPSDVRPPPVLVATLKHIVEVLVPKLPQSHAFIWDRTRSIRQDFTYQNYQGFEASFCCLVIARIHCRALHTMAFTARTVGADWSQQQEIEQFDKCLQSLLEFGQLQPFRGLEEACAYLLLLHLHQTKVVATVDLLPPEISRHRVVQLALELRQLAQTAIPQFFARVRQLDVPPTLRCVAELHFSSLRKQIVRDLALCVHRQRSMYPLNRFQRMLGFETSEEVYEFCEFYDLNISDSESGPEVDLLTWSEANVRDKQSAKPCADESLNALLAQQNLLAYIYDLGDQNGSSAERSAEQIRTENEARKQLLLEQKRQAQREREQREHELEQKRLDEQRQQKINEQQLKEQLEQKQWEQKQLKQQQLAQKQLEQKQLEQKQLEQKQLEQRQLEQRQLQLQRQHQRSEFVASVSNRILHQLVQNEMQTDVQIVLQSLARDQRTLLQRVCQQIARTATKAYQKQQTAQSRAREVQLFRSKRPRVLSQRRSRPQSKYDMSFELSKPGSAPPNEFVVETRALEKIDFAIVAKQLQPAYMQGLRRLAVLSDATSEVGAWLHAELLAQPRLAVFPNEYCELTDCLTPSFARDTAVLNAGVSTADSSVIGVPVMAASASALSEAIDLLVTKYVDRHQSELASLRSLHPKRRRAVSNAFVKPATFVDNDDLSFGSETSQRRESLANAEQRLRRAIAHAKELSNAV